MSAMRLLDEEKKQTVVELTSSMVHKHYCENDIEAVISHLTNDIVWLGAAEHEFAFGKETVSRIFRQFVGQVPKCNISDEEYQVLQIAPDAYFCSGRMWIATDPSTQISLRVHQRITTVFRWEDNEPRCCHIHISNPYMEMDAEDVGFPHKMAMQSYRYLQEQIAQQKAQIEAQTAALRRLSYEDALTGLYNRNKFNEALRTDRSQTPTHLGVAYFDLNGLKAINDQKGHSVGDALIRNTAAQICRRFSDRAYRIGGDEFVVIDDSRGEEDFREAVRDVQDKLRENGIHCSVGISWRASRCSVMEQFEEADWAMYQEKRRFYDQCSDGGQCL